MIRKFLPVPVACIFLLSCTPEPKSIMYGIDVCHYCKMTLVDGFYGAETVTQKGRVYIFDAIECMAASIIRDQIPDEQIFDYYVVAMETEQNDLIPVSDAFLIITEKLPSPMGLNIVSVKDSSVAEDMALMYYGTINSWEEVLEYVRSAWF